MTTPDPARPDPTPAGFTRADLLVLLVGLGVLVSLQLPSLAYSRHFTSLAVCFNSQQQLTRAWRMYAEDNADRLAINRADVNPTNKWCGGWLDNSAYTPDNTNTALLLNAQLGPYTRTPSIYRCPEDPSLSRGRSGEPRVRSVSMNAYMGGTGSPYTAAYRVFRSFAEITSPKPAGAFVFVEEHADSINDEAFIVDMAGAWPPSPSQYRWVDYPAGYHSGGAVLGFADGHAELRTWVDARTLPALQFGQPLPLNQPSPNNRDVQWLQERTTSRVTP